MADITEEEKKIQRIALELREMVKAGWFGKLIVPIQAGKLGKVVQEKVLDP